MGVQVGAGGVPVRCGGHSPHPTPQATSLAARLLHWGGHHRLTDHPPPPPPQATSLPVCSIGGVTTANVVDTIAAGAAGAAVVTAIFDAPSPAEAARELRQRVDSALQAAAAAREREQ